MNQWFLGLIILITGAYVVIVIFCFLFSCVFRFPSPTETQFYRTLCLQYKYPENLWATDPDTVLPNHNPAAGETHFKRRSSHLHRLKVSHTDQCPCDTAPHPTSAPSMTLRHKTWPSQTALQNKLWGTATELQQAAQFIMSTGRSV
jgi:hypothetical protein